jgi:hypothetical protein
MSLRISYIALSVVLLALIAVVLYGCTEDEPALVSPRKTIEGNDTTPPAQIVDPVLTYPVIGGDVVLTWTAPADNNRVDAYDIRYSYSFPLDWEVSLRAEGPPQPAEAGTEQSYLIEAPRRGRDLYAAIRSVDATGNSSPVSNVAHVRVTGHTLSASCVEVIGGDPIEGIDAVVTARHVHSHTSGPDGNFAQGDLTAGTVNVALRYGSSGVLYHAINHPFDLTGDRSVLYKMVPFQETTMGVFPTALGLFKAAADITPQRSVFKKWHSIPVPLHMPDYVNEFGIDYGAVGKAAAERWELRTGIDLWEFVDAPADTGVFFLYKTREQMGIQVGITKHFNGRDGFPIGNEVNIVNDFKDSAPLRITMLHELGHTIRLAHLPRGYLMFGGQPLPSDITDDEVLAVQLYTALPNNLETSIYDHNVPQSAAQNPAGE